MILRDVDRTPVTIYNKVGHSYVRTVVSGCIWKQSIEASFKSQGVLPIDTVKLYILNYEGYVPSASYDGHAGYTITVGNEINNTYIVKGLCDFDFDSLSERELADKVREFERNYDYHRANAVSENFVGSRRMRHLMILC